MMQSIGLSFGEEALKQIKRKTGTFSSSKYYVISSTLVG
jgi:hypothetical protein